MLLYSLRIAKLTFVVLVSGLSCTHILTGECWPIRWWPLAPMKRMKFRQRVSWLLVAMYLAATCGVVYYIFELSDSFNSLALDHMEKYHSASASRDDGWSSWLGGIGSAIWHLTDIPLTVWFIILVFPYLQVFCMLLACTKPEPRLSLAYLWPIYVFLRCRQFWSRYQDPSATFAGLNKAVNSRIANGHPILDTWQQHDNNCGVFWYNTSSSL